MAQLSTLSLPLKTRIFLWVLRAVTDISCRADGTVNRCVFRLLECLRIKAAPDGNPRNGVKTSDVVVDAARGLWFRLFVPTGDRSDGRGLPLVVFYHGGGFVFLGPDFKGYDVFCRCLAREVSAVVVSVNYRLAPEHCYPAQYEDGFDVLKFLDDDDNRSRILPPGTELSKCFLAGDSAGGNIAHHVAVRASRTDFTNLKVIGVLAIQPFFGGEERTKAEIDLAKVDVLISVQRTDWMFAAFLPPGEGANRDHHAINVSGPNAADLSKIDFPPAMVVLAGFDSLKDWQRRYYEWLLKSDKEAYLVEYPKTIHAFYVFPELPETTQLIADIHHFIQKHCSKLRAN